MISFTEAQLLAWITGWMLPLLRVLGLFSTAPILSSRNIPVRAKIALAMALAVMLAPLVNVPEGLTIGSPNAWAVIMRETLIGMAIGFLARLVLMIFELAGEVIGLQIGLSFAGYFTPGAGHGNAVGSITGTIASWLFVVLNGPLMLLATLLHSYERLPVGGGLPGPGSLDPQRLVALLADIFGMALVLALPVLVLILLINFAMGVATRVAPQLNLFAVGFPVLMLAGLAMLSLLIPAFEPAMVKGLETIAALW